MDALTPEFFQHHQWATVRLLEHCQALGSETLDGVVPGTYGSVIATLRHISAADERYLHLLEGTPRRPELTEAAELDLPALLATTRDRGERWLRLLSAGVDPTRRITRTRMDGTQDTTDARTLVVQAIHHGNDHRTQVCTVLGALGLDVPDLDAWTYYSEL